MVFVFLVLVTIIPLCIGSGPGFYTYAARIMYPAAKAFRNLQRLATESPDHKVRWDARPPD